MDDNESRPSDSGEITELGHDSLEEIATNLLKSSYQYFSKFVPEQMNEVETHIATVNGRIGKARDSGDYQRLTASLRLLHQTYAELQERSTISFMASYKPLMGLLDAHKRKLVKGSEAVDEGSVDTQDDADWELNPDALDDMYKPYKDDEIDQNDGLGGDLEDE